MKFFYLILCFPLSLLSDSVSISGNPATFTISSTTAGQVPAAVTNTLTTYTATALIVGITITGKINTNMPTGLTLKVALAAPAGATSAGSVAMTTTAQNLVTNLPLLTLATNGITYTLSATAAAAPVTNGTRTLTLTIQ